MKKQKANRVKASYPIDCSWHPDTTPCYRMKADGGHGHYKIIRCCPENKTLFVLHGDDSFRPGTAVFGVRPDNLSLCGCGNWREWAEPSTSRVLQ